MAKWKTTNSDLQNATQKTEDWITRVINFVVVVVIFHIIEVANICYIWLQ